MTAGRTITVETMSEGRKKVRVVIADDHPLYREGVVRALTATGQVEVVAEAADGRAALAEIERHHPDVAVLDYKLPDLDGLQVTHAVIRDGLPTRVLLLSAFTDSAPALTERERQILKAIAEGKNLPQIASELYLGVTTVKTHVQHLYEKLGVSDRAAAVAEAMRRGVIE